MTEGSVQPVEEAPKPKRNWRKTKADIAAKVGAMAKEAAPAKSFEKSQPAMPEGRVVIMLEENDGISPTGQFFGINGATFMLRPGVEVSVPKGIVDILDNAQMDVPVVDPLTRQVTGWRKKSRYPYRYVRSV